VGTRGPQKKYQVGSGNFSSGEGPKKKTKRKGEGNVEPSSVFFQPRGNEEPTWLCGKKKVAKPSGERRLWHSAPGNIILKEESRGLETARGRKRGRPGDGGQFASTPLKGSKIKLH